jgi:galactokinase
MTLQELASHTDQEFVKAYGRTPRWIAAAPGRVNIIGEHTDYNDGFVMPMGIGRYTVIAAAPAQTSGQITLRTTINKESITIKLDQPVVPWGRGVWANYPAGVIAGFLARGIEVAGFDALIHSNVPLGGGLSSSAALEVATGTLLEIMTGHALDPVEKALLCQKAEHQFAGVPCGIMDQFVSTLARKDHLLLLDCRSHQTKYVPCTDPSVTVLIINTNVHHTLADGAYAKRRAQCEDAARILKIPALRDATLEMLVGVKNRLDETVFSRARHVIGENERTTRMADSVAKADWAAAGRLMYQSHASLRVDYEVSCVELDTVVKIAHSIGHSGGVIGCRMTGGGFGGCAVALVETDAVESISRRLSEEYQQRTNIIPDIFTSRPEGGATVIRA